MDVRMSKQAVYGTAYRATSFIRWRFPNFDLRYMGTQQVRASVVGGPKAFAVITKYQFVAVTKQESVPIWWSSGLGDIAPTSFKVEGQTYFLEMRYSDLLERWIKGKFVIYGENDPVLAAQSINYALARIGPLQGTLSLHMSGIGAFHLTGLGQHDVVLIGQLEPDTQACRRWYALPRDISPKDEWLLPHGNYCVRSDSEQKSHFEILEGKSVIVEISGDGTNKK